VTEAEKQSQAAQIEAMINEGRMTFEAALAVIEDEGLEIGLYEEVNEAGTQEILHFLQANHKRGGSIKDAADAKGWIEDASLQLAEGNAPTVEIGAEYSIHGYAVTYTLSDAGVTVRAVQH
jgi:hypothetical protein